MQMNRTKEWIITAILAIVLSIIAMVCAHAVYGQTRVEGQFITAGSRGLGYTGPQSGAGIRSVGRYNSRWGSDLRLSFLRAPKLQTGDGVVIQGHALARYYFRPEFYGTGGMWFGKARTSQYSKLDGAVVGGAGWQRNLFGFEGAYEHGLNENRQRMLRIGGDIPVARTGNCYILVGGEVLTDRYVNGSFRYTGMRGEFRVSGGCTRGR